MTKHYLRKLDDNMADTEYKMYRAIPAEEIGVENICHHMTYEEWRDWLAGEIAQDEYVTFIMYKDDYPVGEVTVALDPETDGGNLSYVIRPVCRGQGLSSVMLDLAIAEAKNLGVEKLVGFANKVNSASAKTMEKCGFSLMKETEHEKYYEFDLRREEMKKRTINTLFMIMSLDGKISSGATDDFDLESSIQKIPEIGNGLQQYYDLEQQTDLWSFNTARTLTKETNTNYNERTEIRAKGPVSFILVDNQQHFNETAIKYLSNWLQKVVIVTTKTDYETFGYENVYVIHYADKIDFRDLFEQLYEKFDAKNVTIQSGGTLNGVLLREKLFDFVNIVVAPVLVGGKDVSTLIDGDNPRDLADLGILKLRECRTLENSYLNLRYEVSKEENRS